MGITIDMLELSADSDVTVLASGDGDFDMLIERIKSKYQIKTEVYGVEQLTANSLREATDTFIPIDDSLLL